MPDGDVDLERQIGQVVRAWRIERELTVTQLAELGKPLITKPYISQLEHGRLANPGPSFLTRLVQALQLHGKYPDPTVADLVTRRLPHEPPLGAIPTPALSVAYIAAASIDRDTDAKVLSTDDGKYRVTLQEQVAIFVEDLTGKEDGHRIRLEGRTLDGELRVLVQGIIKDGTLTDTVAGRLRETHFQVVPVEEPRQE